MSFRDFGDLKTYLQTLPRLSSDQTAQALLILVREIERRDAELRQRLVFVEALASSAKPSRR